MSALRMVFFTVSLLIITGSWLMDNGEIELGFWLLNRIAILLFFAFLTGICPGLIVWKKLVLSNSVKVNSSLFIRWTET